MATFDKDGKKVDFHLLYRKSTLGELDAPRLDPCSFVAGIPSHLLKPIASIPVLYKPKTVTVTRSLSSAAIIISLLSERDSCVFMY